VSPRPASRAPLASSLVRARLHRPQARTTWPPCSRGAALPGGAASCAVWPRHVAPVCADAGLACMQGRAGAAAAPLSPWWPRGGPRAPPARACPALPPADGAGLDPGPDRMRWAQTGGRRLLVRGVSAPPSAPFVHRAQACAVPRRAAGMRARARTCSATCSAAALTRHAADSQPVPPHRGAKPQGAVYPCAGRRCSPCLLCHERRPVRAASGHCLVLRARVVC